MAEQDSYNSRCHKRVVVKMTGCNSKWKKNQSLETNIDMDILMQPFTFL